jgi:hypothetical protein
MQYKWRQPLSPTIEYVIFEYFLISNSSLDSVFFLKIQVWTAARLPGGLTSAPVGRTIPATWGSFRFLALNLFVFHNLTSLVKGEHL